MSTERIVLDTSVFNVIERKSASEQDEILQLLDPANEEIRLTWETIQEVVSIAGTSKASRLPNRCRILHALLRLPPYISLPYVVRAELCRESVHFAEADHQHLLHVLQRLGTGHSPSNSLRELHLTLGAEKKEHGEGYRRIKKRIDERMRGRPSLLKSTTFADFATRYWQKWSGRLDTLLEAKPGMPALSSILQNPQGYPLSHAFLQTHVAILYRHNVANRRVDPGDVFDASSMVCLASGDTLVSEDGGQRELGELVWGGEKRILPLAEWITQKIQSSAGQS